MLDSKKWILSPMKEVRIKVPKNSTVEYSYMINGGVHFEVSYGYDVYDGYKNVTARFNVMPRGFEKSPNGKFKSSKKKFQLHVEAEGDRHVIVPKSVLTRKRVESLYEYMSLTGVQIDMDLQNYQEFMTPGEKEFVHRTEGIEYLMEGIAKLHSGYFGDLLVLDFCNH